MLRLSETCVACKSGTTAFRAVVAYLECRPGHPSRTLALRRLSLQYRGSCFNLKGKTASVPYEGPMGSGKTEAALVAAYRLIEKNKAKEWSG